MRRHMKREGRRPESPIFTTCNCALVNVYASLLVCAFLSYCSIRAGTPEPYLVFHYGEHVIGVPRVCLAGFVELVDAPLRIIDGVDVALLLEHEAAVILVGCPAISTLVSLSGDIPGVCDTVARVDLAGDLVCGDVESDTGRSAPCAHLDLVFGLVDAVLVDPASVVSGAASSADVLALCLLDRWAKLDGRAPI